MTASPLPVQQPDSENKKLRQLSPARGRRRQADFETLNFMKAFQKGEGAGGAVCDFLFLESSRSMVSRGGAVWGGAEMRREEKAREDRRRARLLRQREEVSSDAEAPAPDEGALPPDAGMELAPSEEMGLAPSDLAPSDGEEGDNPDDAGDEDLEAAHPRRKRKVLLLLFSSFLSQHSVSVN